MNTNKVYIVEDDKNIRELLSYKLEGSGFKVSAYADGESGLDAILETPPDVVLLDLMLPGIDGYEICRRIHLLRQAYPVYVNLVREGPYRIHFCRFLPFAVCSCS